MSCSTVPKIRDDIKLRMYLQHQGFDVIFSSECTFVDRMPFESFRLNNWLTYGVKWSLTFLLPRYFTTFFRLLRLRPMIRVFRLVEQSEGVSLKVHKVDIYNWKSGLQLAILLEQLGEDE